MPNLFSSGLKLIILAAAVAGVARSEHSRRPASAEGTGESRFASEEPPILQKRRARQPARGRHATAPWHIPWLGWKDILWRTYQQIDEDRLLAVAAGVVFFALLAFFPSVTAFVSFYGLFADASTIGDHLSFAASVMPPDAFNILREQVDRIVAKGSGTLSFAFILSLGLACGAPMPA